MKKILIKRKRMPAKTINYEVIKLNTARNALRYIIKAFKIEQIYVPYYICPAVRTALKKENCKVIFYHIDKNFRPIIDFPQDAYILYPDYFGVCSIISGKLSQKYPNLITDNAHAFFSKPVGIASFNSARKFFNGILDGSFLYTTKTVDIDIQQDEYTYEYKELSYPDICKNENRLDKEDIKYMSNCTQEYISTLDFNEEKNKKLQHFNKYKKLFDSKNSLLYKLEDASVPYKYPYLAKSISEADKLASELKNQNMDIFRYWNNMPDTFEEKIFYNQLLAI